MVNNYLGASIVSWIALTIGLETSHSHQEELEDIEVENNQDLLDLELGEEAHCE